MSFSGHTHSDRTGSAHVLSRSPGLISVSSTLRTPASQMGAPLPHRRHPDPPLESYSEPYLENASSPGVQAHSTAVTWCGGVDPSAFSRLNGAVVGAARLRVCRTRLESGGPLPALLPRGCAQMMGTPRLHVIIRQFCQLPSSPPGHQLTRTWTVRGTFQKSSEEAALAATALPTLTLAIPTAFLRARQGWPKPEATWGRKRCKSGTTRLWSSCPSYLRAQPSCLISLHPSL